MTQRSRSFCFTLNNYTQQEYDLLKSINCQYIILGKEVGEKGTPHIQGYLYFSNARSFNATKKLMSRWHLEICKGSADQNIEYCKKDKNFEEFGTRPQPGKRTDLILIKEEIMEGKKVDDIALENPNIFHQYGRTLNKLEDLAMRKKFRTEMTAGIWYWGPTGVGKSHKAFEGFTPETHYVWPKDGHWWDAYTQQDIVIINDFRGEIPYNDLLQMVDKWPYFVRRRGREPIPFISKKIIITSSLPPEEIYKHRNAEDRIEQLLRRFFILEIKKIDTEVVGGNTKPLPPELNEIIN